jgi:RNA polymerase sigma-70 factor, ECF subfamily
VENVAIEDPAPGAIHLTGMVPDTETNLVARCCRGESAAWDELFDRHYTTVGRFIFQLGRDFTREDIEEISQEVFLAVIKNIDRFQAGCQLQTWLFRIAANKAADFRERQHAAKRGGGHVPLSLQAEDPVTGLTLDPPSSAPPPDLALLSLEQAGLVHQALDGLEQPCREIIELRYFGDLSYDEISRALQLNPKTVSSRLSKCLDRLETIVRKIFSGENSALFPSNS